jgi:Lipoprotein LpqB beta-propeller domain
LSVACLIAGCGGGGDAKSVKPAQAQPTTASSPFNAAAFARAARVPGPRLDRGTLLVSHSLAVGPIAVDRHYLVAVVGSVEGEDEPPKLVQRRVDGGRVTTLTEDVQRNYGVASTEHWVAFVPDSGDAIVAIHHDGSGRQVLSGPTVTPIASRGNLIAWAEQDRHHQRVFVRDLETGAQWTAADLPRCMGKRCYRIDAVTLANDGVAFTRGAIGPQPSLVVRRAFTAAKPFAIQVPDDPQPDLAPSSEGALFNDFSRGWFRWDFRSDAPRHLTLGKAFGQDGVQLLEGNELLLMSSHGCGSKLSSRTGSGPVVPVTSPARLIRLGRERGHGICVESLGVSWSGGQPLSSWALEPDAAAQAHSDEGLGGLAVAGTALG